ncbi:hypothetical protein BGW38_009631, partial [Lunasporangiospora selenospora]
LPAVSGGNPATFVKADSVADTEDVMVHINFSNLDSFFYEGIADRQEDVINLKKLIRHITPAH